MSAMRAAALPIVLLALLCAACSSSGPEATPAPSAAPIGTPSAELAKVSSTTAPTLLDRNCADFATQVDAQEFYIEAGGPDQDLHGIDPDHNGNACDEQSPSPVSSATVGTAPPGTITAPAAAPTPVPSPSEITATQGVVEGESGGSGSQSSCESSDTQKC
jgi:hypothetical protein